MLRNTIKKDQRIGVMCGPYWGCHCCMKLFGKELKHSMQRSERRRSKQELQKEKFVFEGDSYFHSAEETYVPDPAGSVV